MRMEARASCLSCVARPRGQKAQLRERVAQLSEEIAGLPRSSRPRRTRSS